MKKKDESKVAGGVARSLALTPERKREIAAKAAAARWGTLPRATHRGNFKEDFGIEVDCYVLNDERKTESKTMTLLPAAQSCYCHRRASGSLLLVASPRKMTTSGAG